KPNNTRFGTPQVFTSGDQIDSPTAWLEDGRTLLFHSDRSRNFDVFKQGLADRSPERIVSGPDDETEAHLSPDGASILYLDSPGPREASSQGTRLMRVPQVVRLRSCSHQRTILGFAVPLGLVVPVCWAS